MRLLNRTQVIELLDPAEVLPMMRTAFESYASDAENAIAAQRAPFSLPGDQNPDRNRGGSENRSGSGMLIFPGVTAGIPAYSVKVHAKYPTQEPSIRGVLLLHDLDTGALLAAMDSTYLTAVRTGLAAALATDALARKNAHSVAVIGAGVQGEFMLRFLSLQRSLSDIAVYDTDMETARRFQRRLSEQDDITGDTDGDLTVADSLTSAVANRDIVLCATWAREPFLSGEVVEPGMHITTLGSDQPGKLELAPSVLDDAVFVCDDRDLTVEMGAIGNADLRPETIDATLGEVLADAHPGRTGPETTTVFASVGLAFQDVVAAWQVYQAARQQGVGTKFDFRE
jgi:ornithine cyclodeaminase/alanine dehydrogenase-like protein (mu-crystallin family)